MAELTGPTEAWRSSTNAANRSAGESVEFWKGLAVDGGVTQTNQVLEKLTDLDFFKRVDLSCEGCGPVPLQWRLEDPNVMAENETASMIGNLAVALVTRRLRSCMVYSGFPGSLPALLSSDHAEHVLTKLRGAIADFNTIEHERGAFWEKVRKRSPLKWVKVQQVAIIAQEHDWKMSDELRDLIRNDLAGITRTKLVEDAVRSERLAENKGSSNRILCGGKCLGRPDPGLRGEREASL